MSEKFEAEFTIVPIFIGFAPALVMFPLLVVLEKGGPWYLFFSVLPIVLLMLLLIVMTRKSKAVVHLDAFEFSSSFLTRRVKRIEASKIESVAFSESIIGRSRWGSVTVRGTGLGALRVKDVKYPEKLADAVRSIASSPSPKNRKSESSHLVSDLGDLKRLLDDGIITQDEFEKAKNKRLNL